MNDPCASLFVEFAATKERTECRVWELTMDGLDPKLHAGVELYHVRGKPELVTSLRARGWYGKIDDPQRSQVVIRQHVPRAEGPPAAKVAAVWIAHELASRYGLDTLSLRLALLATDAQQRLSINP